VWRYVRLTNWAFKACSKAEAESAIQQLQSELNVSQHAAKLLEQRLIATEQRQQVEDTSKHQEIATLQQTIEALKGALSERLKDFDAAAHENQVLVGDLTAAHELTARLQQQVQSFDELSHARIAQALQESSEALRQSHGQQISVLQQHLEDMRVEAEKAQQALSDQHYTELDTIRRESEEKLAAASHALASSDAGRIDEIERLNIALAEALQVAAELQQSVTASSADTHEAQVHELRASLQTQEAQHEHAINELRASVTQLQVQIDGFNNDLTRVNGEKAAVEQELQQAQSRAAELAISLAEAQKSLAVAEQSLKEGDRELQVIATIVETDVKPEIVTTAVAAVEAPRSRSASRGDGSAEAGKAVTRVLASPLASKALMQATGKSPGKPPGKKPA
jgi:predicted  nucleic acid-binding Zn-ribbon protein